MRQAITTKFIGPTNHRGSRISVRCQAKRIVVGWDHALDMVGLAPMIPTTPIGGSMNQYPHIKVGDTVGCGYRTGHQGIALDVTDPRAWAGTLAFPEASPDASAVAKHVERYGHEHFQDRVPVLWTTFDTPRVYWDHEVFVWWSES
jgi:hypothetical protein